MNSKALLWTLSIVLEEGFSCRISTKSFNIGQEINVVLELNHFAESDCFGYTRSWMTVAKIYTSLAVKCYITGNMVGQKTETGHFLLIVAHYLLVP